MSEIRPALSADEWDMIQQMDVVICARLPRRDLLIDLPEEPAARHATAAVALHGQPFGFTWEDVATLQESRCFYASGGSLDLIDRMESLEARIAALLPPEPK